MTGVPEASIEALAAHGRDSVKETRQKLELAVRRLVNGNPQKVPKGTKLAATKPREVTCTDVTSSSVTAGELVREETEAIIAVSMRSK